MIQDGELITTWQRCGALLITRVPVGCNDRLDCEMHVDRDDDDGGRLTARFMATLRRIDGRQEHILNLGTRPMTLPGPLPWPPAEDTKERLTQAFVDAVRERADSLPSPAELNHTMSNGARLDGDDRSARFAFDWTD